MDGVISERVIIKSSDEKLRDFNEIHILYYLSIFNTISLFDK
jgi:hypothetical protein